jgi:ATPase subunit of ABC transporter with duplicated ATPase domains
VKPNEGELIAFKGTYSELRAEREQKEYEAFMAAQKKADIRNSGSDNRVSTNESRKSKNANTKEERRKIAQVQELENKIAELEKTLANLTAQLESPLVKPDEVIKIGNEYNRVQAEMDEKLAEWEHMQS